MYRALPVLRGKRIVRDDGLGFLDSSRVEIWSKEQHTVDGGLTAQLLEHLGRTSESITRLADGDVQNELLDAEIPHGVLGLLRLKIKSMLANTKQAGSMCCRFVP